MKKLLLVSLCFLFYSLQIFAQNRTINGTVIAKEDGGPIPGVGVRVKGTTIGVSTGPDGKYSLSVPSSATTLEFSFIGYSTLDKVITGSTINATLEVSSKQLGEVVVTALGISRETRTLGYSTGTVKSDDLTKARETNVLNSLAGQMAGVRVNSQSGTLGGSSRIIIRGNNSLSPNATLYVIDGLEESDPSSVTGTAALNNVDYGDRMGDLSPDDIESITVLKGAAAAALYGARARDGAVIITTKRGKKGNVSVDINSSLDFSNPLALPDFQNDYAQGNNGVYALTSVNGWGPKISDVANQTFPNFLGQSVHLQAYPNNVKDYFKTGTNLLNNISISGADDKSDYRVSFSSANEKGTIPQSTLDRYSLSLNVGRNFSKTITSRFTGSYTNIAADGRPAQASNNTNGLVNVVYGLPRTVDINQLANNYQDPITGAEITLSPNRNANNPYWIMNYNRNANTVDRFVSSYNLTYKPLDWITLGNTFGADIYTEKRSELIRVGTVGYPTGGQFTNADLLNKTLNDDLLATFEQNNLVKDFKFKLVLGGNLNQRFLQTSQVLAVGLTVDQLYNYTNAAVKTPTLTYAKQRSEALFGDLSISYKDYLYLDVTGRNDWTSTLPVDSRSYFYPSVSGSFIFSELLKNNEKFNWLTSGKVRASWASVGSDIGPYNLDYVYTPVSTVFFQYLGNLPVFPAGAITTGFTAPGTLPNNQLVPQKVNSYEFGTDLSFLGDRIGLGFTYYSATVSNNLINITIPPSTGYGAKTVNAGVVNNNGIEVELKFVPIKIKDFRWDLGFNFNKDNQKVLELAPGLTQFSLPSSSAYSGLIIKAEVGQSFGMYGTAWARSPDGQYVITKATGLKAAVTNQRLGNIYADWTGGIKNTFSYKGFSLFTLLDVRKGGIFYSGTIASLRSSGLAAETGGDRSVPIIDKGVNLVAGQYVPNTTPVSSQAYWVWQGSTTNTEGNIFDAGYIKLRQVEFAYKFPKSLFNEKSVIKGLQVGLEGTNLWLIKSSVKGVDPDASFLGTGAVGEGVEFNSIPSSRVLGMNLRLSL